MDKTGKPFSLKLPLALETKIRDKARRSGKPFCTQCKIYLAQAAHFDSFDMEEFCTTLSESEENNGSAK